jgi:hypothetical protein
MVLVELEQKRTLEAEQCQCQHKVIDLCNLAGWLVGDLHEALAFRMQKAERA